MKGSEQGPHVNAIDRFATGPHWYRRLNFGSLAISIGILLLYVISLNKSSVIDNVLRPDDVTALLALVTAVAASAALVRGWKQAAAAPTDMVSYSLLVATIAILIYQSNGLSSPYIAAWLVVALFAGLFGWAGVGGLALVSNLYILWQIIMPHSSIGNERYALAIACAELPLIVSILFWRHRPTSEMAAHQAIKAVEAQLKQTAGQADIVISSIADGVLAINQQGSIQLINPAAQSLLGWKGGDAVGLHYELVLKLIDAHEQPLSAGRNPIEQVRITKQPIVNNDLTLITGAGRKLMVSLVVSPIINKDNEVEAVIIVLRDITDEKAQERAQAEFVSTASHEMRTPVAAIEGYVGLALNPSTATIDPKARAYLQKAEESLQHLGRLFQDLLSVSRADDNRLEQHLQVTDIIAFARDITDSLREKARQKGLTIEFLPDGGNNEADRKLAPIFYANVDRDHLREILANLIENAIKYTPAGNVKVNVDGDDTRLVISVADSGIGIPSEDIPHLFQKFYRVDNTATREIGGTGLGLYLCRKLIESMGGKIWLESTLNKGSTFYISMQRLSSMDLKNIKESAQISSLHGNSTVAVAPAGQTAPQPVPAMTAAPASAPVAAAPVVAPAPTPTVSHLPLAPVPENAGLIAATPVASVISDIAPPSVTPPPPAPLTAATPQPIADVFQVNPASAASRAPLAVPARQAKL